MADVPEDQILKIPRLEEELTVSRRVIPGSKIHVEKHVERERVTIDELVGHDEVEIERRALGRVLDDDEELPTSRQEADATVFPVIEERLVVRVERVLEEEIWVRRRTQHRRVTDELDLRRERVVIERTDDTEGAASAEIDAASPSITAPLEEERP